MHYRPISWGGGWRDRLGYCCAWHSCRASGTFPPRPCSCCSVKLCIFSLRSNRWSGAGGRGTALKNFCMWQVLHVAGIADIWDAFFYYRTLCFAWCLANRRLRYDWLGLRYDWLGLRYDSLGLRYDWLGLWYDWLGSRQIGGVVGPKFFSFCLWWFWVPNIFLDCLADGCLYF